MNSWAIRLRLLYSSGVDRFLENMHNVLFDIEN